MISPILISAIRASIAESVSLAETSPEAKLTAVSGSELVFTNFAFITCALYLSLSNVYVYQTAGYLYLWAEKSQAKSGCGCRLQVAGLRNLILRVKINSVFWPPVLPRHSLQRGRFY